MLIDTHAHLDYPDFQSDFAQVLENARLAGVSRIITIATGLESSRRVVRLAEENPNVFAVVGIHPTHAHEESEQALEEIVNLARHPKVVAIGETGLDYHELSSRQTNSLEVISALRAEVESDLEAIIAEGAIKDAQQKTFRELLDVAVEVGKNVVIHQREAWDDTLAILAPYQNKVRGVFHCFGGSKEQAMEVLNQGHLVSFTGIVTFKNAESVRQTAQLIPSDKFMVETDCPYLAPVPFRGKRCEPAHSRLVAEKLAEIRGVKPEELFAQTTKTAEAFFKLS